MSTFDDPFDSERELHRSGCGCGRHASAREHDEAARVALQAATQTEERRFEGVVASAVLRAMFPRDATRRAFLKAVGVSTALAAISQFLPLKRASEAFAQGAVPEKKDLKIGFIPITCGTPIIMAQPMGFYAKHGLNVEVKFAVPFDYSMHNYLLRYYVAEHGLDPDTDIQIRAVPPPEMVANLRADNLDGFLAPDPMNQRAVYDGVGFIHVLSKEIWEGHPCCVFAASREFVTAMPNTYGALVKAIIDATAFATKPENRKQIAEAIAPANYLNQPVTVVEQVLTGTFADGLGNVRKVPDRIDFDPFPWESFAVWILTQMKRWGQIKGDVDYKAVARQVFLATDSSKLMREAGLTPPASTSKSFVVMGKPFDPEKPEDYVKSFAIKRA